MRWIITKDHIYHAGDPDSINCVGTGDDDHGTRLRMDIDDVSLHARFMPTEFRLLDDDDEIYYEGRTFDINEFERRAFAPLDWAEGDGCTQMQYRPAGSSKPWSTL